MLRKNLELDHARIRFRTSKDGKSIQMKGNISMRLIIVFFFFSIVGMLSGCGATRLSQNLVFKNRIEKLPFTIGLYIQPEIQNYEAMLYDEIGTFHIVAIGKSLIPNLECSLSQIFSSITLIQDLSNVSMQDQNINYFISIDSLSTDIDVSYKPFAPENVAMIRIQLQYSVTGPDGHEVSSGLIDKTSVKGNWMWNFFGGILGNSGTSKAVKQASEESLKITLEELNDRLVTVSWK